VDSAELDAADDSRQGKERRGNRDDVPGTQGLVTALLRFGQQSRRLSFLSAVCVIAIDRLSRLQSPPRSDYSQSSVRFAAGFCGPVLAHAA